MYFTVNLAFANYFDNWIDSIIPTTDLDITEGEQIFPIALQDLTSNTSKLLDKPKHPRDHITQFKSEQIFWNNKGILTQNPK